MQNTQGKDSELGFFVLFVKITAPNEIIFNSKSCDEICNIVNITLINITQIIL